MGFRSAASALFVLLAASIGAAEANDLGFYVGGSVGLASKNTPRTEYDLFAQDVHAFYGFTPSTSEASFDDRDDTLSLLVGYRFSRHIALEGAYARLGELSHKTRSAGAFPNDQGILDTSLVSDTTGFSVAALGVLPLTYAWEVYGRAGVLFATNEVTAQIDAVGEVFVQPGGRRVVQSFSRSSEDFFAGVGVSLRFFDIYDARLEYQRLFDAGLELTMNPGDLDAVSLGVTVTF